MKSIHSQLAPFFASVSFYILLCWVSVSDDPLVCRTGPINMDLIAANSVGVFSPDASHVAHQEFISPFVHNRAVNLHIKYIFHSKITRK